MLHALGRNGQATEALRLFDRLRDEVNAPTADLKTLMHVIGACSHSGDDGCTERAKAIFAEAMAKGALSESEREKLVSAFVDCLSRGGALV